MAEWTALPFVFSSWQAMQVEESAFLSRGTGCLAADALPARVTRRKSQHATFPGLIPAETNVFGLRTAICDNPTKNYCARSAPLRLAMMHFDSQLVTLCC